MRLERISLQLEDGEVRTFEFHSGLTVVEAEPGGGGGLSRALLGTLSSGGDGVHVELSLDDGGYEVAFRPFGARHQVIDTETSADRSERYRRADGGIDVLRPFIGDLVATRDLVVTGDDLMATDPTDGWIAHLAELDTAALLHLAAEAVAAEQGLRGPVDDARTAPGGGDDLAATASQRAAVAERRYRVLLPTTAVVGSGLAIGAAIGVDTIGTPGSLALIGGALALVAGTLLYGRQVNAALVAGDEAQASATGRNPGGELAQRSVAPGPPSLVEAAERHRRAAAAWQDVAGTIPAPWALGERIRIERTGRLRQLATSDRPGPAPMGAPPAAAAVMAALTVRMASSFGGGPDPETLPLFLDDPLCDLDWADKAPVLELLGRLAAAHQLILVTADPAILSWARLEAMTGSVGAITSASVEEQVAAADTTPPTRAV